jgi:carbonic anhydrase
MRCRTEEERANRLCELNMIEQVVNVSQTMLVRGAWARGQVLTVHGWLYDLHDGLIRDLGIDVDSARDVPSFADVARNGVPRIHARRG